MGCVRRSLADAASRPFIVVAVILFLAAALPAWAQDTCGVCGAALTDKSVVVTDWETNREQRYHDMTCAIRDMAARFPWSRAVAYSPVSAQRVSLTRVNGSWRSEPEGALVLTMPTAAGPAAQAGCGNSLVFASAGDLRSYRDQHRSEISAGAQEMDLAQLPARLGIVGAPPAATAEVPQTSQPGPGQAAPPRAAAATTAPTSQTPSTGFSDVPADHWAAKYVETVKALGLMEGYSDGTFRGGQPVTRYELAAILSRMAEKGMSASAQGGVSAAPSSVAPPSPAPQPAPAMTPPTPAPAGATSAGSAAASRPGAEPSLLGLSGLMTAPDATTRQAGDMAFVGGVMNNKVLGAAATGLGDGIEVAATSAWIDGDNRLFLSGKKRIDSLSRPGLDVSAGFTGLGSDGSAFAAATKQVQLGHIPARVTLGAGTGGVLDGVFAGAAVPLGHKLIPFAQSAEVIAESVDNGDGRDFNVGLGLAVKPDLDLKLGEVNGHFAGGLMFERGF
jgi:hypothetical protein